MAIKLNDHYLSTFIRSHEYANIEPQVRMADKMLREKTGPGKDFLGWINLPYRNFRED